MKKNDFVKPEGQGEQLKVAARRFETKVEAGKNTGGLTGVETKFVAGPLKTTVLLILA
jgi:hypothetical protein